MNSGISAADIGRGCQRLVDCHSRVGEPRLVRAVTGHVEGLPRVGDGGGHCQGEWSAPAVPAAVAVVGINLIGARCARSDEIDLVGIGRDRRDLGWRTAAGAHKNVRGASA